MAIRVALEPISVTVEPGGQAVVALRVQNMGHHVEEYHVDLVGGPAMWGTVEPATMRLIPGTTETVRLTFAPPGGSGSGAGPYPYGARLRRPGTPVAEAVCEGTVSVAPARRPAATVVPPGAGVHQRVRNAPAGLPAVVLAPWVIAFVLALIVAFAVLWVASARRCRSVSGN